LNLRIQVHPVAGDDLIDDYHRQVAGLAPFFAGSPFEPAAYRRKADEVRARFDQATAAATATAVRPMGPEAREKLEAIAAGTGFFVTTGQQPGLFGGPLYTIHKALTAVALAERLEAILEAPVLALFWVASDDHDWEEANHVHVLDPGNSLRRLALDGEARPPRSMGRRTLGRAAETALSDIAETLPPSEFTPPLLKRLQAAYGADATVAGAFTETVVALFDGLPIGLVDGQDPVVRRRAAPVLRRDLEASAEHEAALRDRTERLGSAGYTAQVTVLPGASNVFYEDDAHGRDRLVREGDGWRLRASGERLTEAELWALWDRDPSGFSANVVLRPVVESCVFPTLAYVAGPGEIRYLAQTGGLFEAHGIGMPLVFPRLGVTLVEKKVEKVMDRFGLDMAAFRRPVDELVATVVRDDVPEEVGAAIARLRETLQSGYQEVFEAARGVDPTLKGPIFGARNDAFRGLSEVDKKIRQHVKLKQETELEQLEKAAVNLSPMGKPQERVLNVHQYLARYGPELLGAILGAVRGGLDGRLTAAGVTTASTGSGADGG
jgi:bacillithiol synthase